MSYIDITAMLDTLGHQSWSDPGHYGKNWSTDFRELDSIYTTLHQLSMAFPLIIFA